MNFMLKMEKITGNRSSKPSAIILVDSWDGCRIRIWINRNNCSKFTQPSHHPKIMHTTLDHFSFFAIFSLISNIRQDYEKFHWHDIEIDQDSKDFTHAGVKWMNERTQSRKMKIQVNGMMWHRNFDYFLYNCQKQIISINTV